MVPRKKPKKTCDCAFEVTPVFMNPHNKPFMEGRCDYSGQNRDFNTHACFKEYGAPLFAWYLARRDMFKVVNNKVEIPFETWQSCDEFKIAVEESLTSLVNNKPNFSNVVRQQGGWLIGLCTIARSINAKVPVGAEGAVDAIFRLVRATARAPAPAPPPDGPWVMGLLYVATPLLDACTRTVIRLPQF